VVARLGHSDKLLVLRKPAVPIEVLQCATALSRKWENERWSKTTWTIGGSHHGPQRTVWKPLIASLRHGHP